MKTILTASAVIATVLAVSSALGQQGGKDVWLGTWKLNVEKSKADPADLLPKSQTLRIENVPGGGQRHTTDAVSLDGKPLHSERTFTSDGADVPVEGAGAGVTNSLRRVDDHSFKITVKRDGKVMFNARAVVSSDGKTLTTTLTGTPADGRKASSAVYVYEKQ
jgi:hypothetical protein